LWLFFSSCFIDPDYADSGFRFYPDDKIVFISLKYLDIINFKTPKLLYMNDMFQRCNSLASFDISKIIFKTNEV